MTLTRAWQLLLRKVLLLRKKTEIDGIDAKILRALLKESRTSFTDLAKLCNISIGAVRMRYAQLKKAGIINGEVMLVNPHSLGCKHISDLGIITSADYEPEVKEALRSKPYVAHIVGPFGKYSFWAKVALRDTQELAGILEDLESIPHIKHVDALIWVEAINVEHAENLIIKPLIDVSPLGAECKPSSGNERVEIDEIDRRIARILSQNSRMPFRRIAEQVGISTKNVIQRYRRLRRDRVLTLSSVTVDLNKLGYNAMASLFVKAANRSKMPEIHNQLLKIPNLIVAIRLIGSYDLYASVVLEDFQQLFGLNEQIRKIHGIEKTDIFLTPNVPAWPLNLFPSLLESGRLLPKFFLEPQCDK
jgi:Lrp/AsnC family transcriptional regulator for asnA, asnC and gidA